MFNNNSFQIFLLRFVFCIRNFIDYFRAMDIETEAAIDYTFHNKFWSLIQYLQDPGKVFKHDEDWVKSMGYLGTVLQALNSVDVTGTSDPKKGLNDLLKLI